MNKFVIRTAYTLLTAVHIALSGLLLMTGWEWFIVPLGVAAIGIWQSLGIMTLLALYSKAVSYDNTASYGQVLFISYCLLICGFCFMSFYKWMM
jgi:hypothetical protein